MVVDIIRVVVCSRGGVTQGFGNEGAELFVVGGILLLVVLEVMVGVSGVVQFIGRWC